MQNIFRRITLAFFKVPSSKDWLYTAVILLGFALVYLPIGFKLEFLKVELQSSRQTILGVATGTFFMPAFLEELGFRVLIIPHLSETLPPNKRWFQIIFSWSLFMAYHLHPFVPTFFKAPAFLIGTGLIGISCTFSYLKSGSLWTPLIIHWLIVMTWLLTLGGLEKFES